jgi:hypothetical protein
VVAVITKRTADGSRSPEVEAGSFARSTARSDPRSNVSPIARPIIPTKINRDAHESARTARGPGQAEMHDHPDAGLNLRRERTPGAPPDEAM